MATRWEDIISELETPFSTTEWTRNEIFTIPVNYDIPVTASEYVRTNIIAGRSDPTYSGSTVTGQLKVNLFIPSGKGLKRGYEIADLLDGLLEKKRLSSIVQTFTSVVTPVGVDPSNSKYYMLNYTMPFTAFI